MNGHWDGEAKGAWTALSRAPYLKAFTLLAKGDCWHGGGLFTSNTRYWLNDGYGHEMIRDSGELKRETESIPSREFGGECLGVYYVRLLRDGWTLVRRENLGKWKEQTIFEKPISCNWTLRKIAHEEVGAPPGKGCYWDEHALVSPRATIACPEWEWADVDGERLVWAAGGKLLAGRVNEQGLSEESELCDFNAMIFAPIRAPY